MSFFALLFFFQFFEHFSDFFASIFLQNQNFHGRKFIFPLFIFSFLFSCFLSFLSLLMFLSKWSDDRGQDTSPREMSEGSGGNGPQCLNRRSLVGVFLSMTESLSWWTWINHGEGHGWWFLARLGSNSVFLVIEWLVCDTDSPRYTRKWMLIIISLCPLSPLLLSLCLPSFLNTWQKNTGNIGQLIRWSVSKINGRRSC